MSRPHRPEPPAESPVASSRRQAIFVVQAADGQAQARYDEVAAEEPLSIRVRAAWQTRENVAGTAAEPQPAADAVETRALSITLRTPESPPSPSDAELALGYLFSEGLLSGRADVTALCHPEPNVVEITLRPDLRVPWRSVERAGVTSSACGLCGKRSLDALSAQRAASLWEPDGAGPLPPQTAGELAALSEKLAAAQPIFARTGGLHAAALFDWQGRLLAVREDIGRHNAVDKLLGSQLLGAADPQAPLRLSRHILWVSGRAGYELVQKACMAGLPLFVAVGAPSSLAVQLAKEAGMSLVAFCRKGQFNVYSGPDRIALSPSARQGA